MNKPQLVYPQNCLFDYRDGEHRHFISVSFLWSNRYVKYCNEKELQFRVEDGFYMHGPFIPLTVSEVFS